MSELPPVFTGLPSRNGQAGRLGANALSFGPDKRDEQLQRAGYLLVVHTDRLVRAAAALVIHTGRCAVKQALTLRQTVVRRGASRTGG